MRGQVGVRVGVGRRGWIDGDGKDGGLMASQGKMAGRGRAF